MKKLLLFATIFIFATLVLSLAFLPTDTQAATDQDDACWGQASAVFAQTGEMGKHASQQSTPRAGLYNLAQELYADGEGPLLEPTLQALGAYVASALGLTIEACQ